jgi:hypothetical protein
MALKYETAQIRERTLQLIFLLADDEKEGNSFETLSAGGQPASSQLKMDQGQAVPRSQR